MVNLLPLSGAGLHDHDVAHSRPSRAVILLVDDTPANLHMLMQTLTDEGFRVLVAESGTMALESTSYLLPDIILLDVVMPELDGFETCRRLKVNPDTADIPVLFLSALDEAIDKVQGFAVGGVDYITKPIQGIEVLARIRTHLKLRRLQQRLQQQNESLEERVAARTAQLQTEIEHRKQQERQRHKLLDVLEQQSDQLHELTTWLLKDKQTQQQHFAQSGLGQLTQRLQQAHQQREIIEAIALTLQNTTERYNLTTHLHRLQTSMLHIATELALITEGIHQPPTNIQEALADPLLTLSAREREVLQLVVDGKSNPQIAELLYLSEITVRTHRRRLLQKLQLADTTALIKFAVQRNLTTVE